jgi:hypothetical protein
VRDTEEKYALGARGVDLRGKARRHLISFFFFHLVDDSHTLSATVLLSAPILDTLTVPEIHRRYSHVRPKSEELPEPDFMLWDGKYPILKEVLDRSREEQASSTAPKKTQHRSRHLH